MVTAAVVLAVLLLLITAHLLWSTQTLRHRWRDMQIIPRRRKV